MNAFRLPSVEIPNLLIFCSKRALCLTSQENEVCVIYYTTKQEKLVPSLALRNIICLVQMALSCVLENELLSLFFCSGRHSN